MIGLGAWGLKIFYAATSDRNLFKFSNFVVFAVGALNCLWIIHDLSERDGLNEFKQFIAWISLSMIQQLSLYMAGFTHLLILFAVFSFILPTTSSNSFRDRLMAIISSLALPYCLLSLTYEPLFYMTFTSNIYYWVSMIYTDRKQMYTVCNIAFNLMEIIDKYLRKLELIVV